MDKKAKIIIAVTGSSGSLYALNLLNKLYNIRNQFEECVVVFSENAKKVWEFELENNNFTNIPFKLYDNNDFFSPIASGSAGYNTMIVIPCSMGCMGRIASGLASDLISRAADVIIKERQRLILVTREMPLNLIHINNMKTLTEAGAIISPACPSFYFKPETIDELVDTVTDRILDLADLEYKTQRWGK